MPHFVIEHFTEDPDALDTTKVREIALRVAGECGAMDRRDVKVRTVRPDAILFGDGRRSFIHVTISLLAGRSDDKKRALAEMLVGAYREAFGEIEAISVDVRDMNPACYKKSLVEGRTQAPEAEIAD
ncbi:hypothetical protein HGO38_28495 [Rhizobium sp. CG5]|uniref:5-carboxymethyl-2-hydroxymuconate Delta-isomerase n=1 Tax=Rhizobium sp. CG5 TaxID=2726076 RepID=UPI002033B603|nr:hypothetical protein [Rhizobium sp. CG5]MCM2477390.1 hypothetical protein [Rhizobium sp. CG5]